MKTELDVELEQLAARGPGRWHTILAVHLVSIRLGTEVVHLGSDSVRRRPDIAGVASARTQEPFISEVPRLLKERRLSMRALARRADVSDAHLSRVLRQVHYKTPSSELARRVALAFDLPEDYFPEFREAFVVQRVKQDEQLRERLYKRLRARR